MIGIMKENKVSQQMGTAPNLGGPTSIYLADPEKENNRNWADRYLELNQGAGQ